MKSTGNKLSRKKFLFFSVAVSALLGIPAFLRPRFQAKKNKTVRMLTEDGKLVEVDATLLPSKKQKLALNDIRTWVHKKISSP